MNINPKAKCEVLVTDLDFQVIKTIANCLDYNSDNMDQINSSKISITNK